VDFERWPRNPCRRWAVRFLSWTMRMTSTLRHDSTRVLSSNLPVPNRLRPVPGGANSAPHDQRNLFDFPKSSSKYRFIPIGSASSPRRSSEIAKTPYPSPSRPAQSEKQQNCRTKPFWSSLRDGNWELGAGCWGWGEWRVASGGGGWRAVGGQWRADEREAQAHGAQARVTGRRGSLACSMELGSCVGKT